MSKLLKTALIFLFLMASLQVSAQKKVKEITQEQFAQLVFDYTSSHGASSPAFLGAKPCIVDFNATWCGPCRRLAPIIEDLANEYDGLIDFYSVDIDENQELAKALELHSIPFLLFCPSQPDAQPVGMVGFHPREEVVEVIDSVLLINPATEIIPNIDATVPNN